MPSLRTAAQKTDNSPEHINLQQKNADSERSAIAKRTKSLTLLESGISEHTDDLFEFKYQIPHDRVWEYR